MLGSASSITVPSNSLLLFDLLENLTDCTPENFIILYFLRELIGNLRKSFGKSKEMVRLIKYQVYNGYVFITGHHLP